jgi:hypothetical protein
MGSGGIRLPQWKELIYKCDSETDQSHHCREREVLGVIGGLNLTGLGVGRTGFESYKMNSIIYFIYFIFSIRGNNIKIFSQT